MKAKHTQNFCKMIKYNILPGKDVQSLIGILEKADEILIIVSLNHTSMPTGSSNCIDLSVYIPVSDSVRDLFNNTNLNRGFIKRSDNSFYANHFFSLVSLSDKHYGK